MLRSLCLAGAVSLLGLAFASPARALLIEHDLIASGDGLLTVDTLTGLEWLDLPVTLNVSLNDALATWSLEGFRQATRGEGCALVNAYTFYSGGCNAGTQSAPGNVVADFRSLFGATSLEVFTLGTLLEGTLEVSYLEFQGDVSVVIFDNTNAIPDLPYFFAGHFLVRPSTGGSAPEPAALVLLLLGSAGAARALGRRSAKPSASRA